MSDRWEEAKRLTAEAMNAPAIGDRFHDMYTFWVYVLDIGAESVTTYEVCGHPSTFPGIGGKLRVFATREEFRKAFQYGSIPGYYVTLEDRGNDVSGWLHSVASGSVSVLPEETPGGTP